MAARERKAGESFGSYRANLKKEEKAAKRKKAGRLFYESGKHIDEDGKVVRPGIPYVRKKAKERRAK